MDTLIHSLFALLAQKQWQIATAESCTGGLISAAMTAVPGSSRWFERGFVTYSNLAKEEMLGVDSALIMRDGAVSESVALAMAEGAVAHSQAQVALAVTGIAGPDGGSENKPVGTVCFAWVWPQGGHQTAKYQFQGDRESIRQQACQVALARLIQALEDQACQK